MAAKSAGKNCATCSVQYRFLCLNTLKPLPRYFSSYQASIFVSAIHSMSRQSKKSVRLVSPRVLPLNMTCRENLSSPGLYIIFCRNPLSQTSMYPTLTSQVMQLRFRAHQRSMVRNLVARPLCKITTLHLETYVS